MDNLSKNAILTGFIESFCLLCEVQLKTEEDVDNHIDDPAHQNNLELAPYLENYKDDRIRKVNSGFYCEFCNLLVLTTAKVDQHIADETHCDNKGSQLLKTVGDKIVAFDEIIITQRAWNGLIDNTCVICNMEFDDEQTHCKVEDHILNLIPMKVVFGIGKAISREIDDTNFQCLTCNKILAKDTLKTHFDTEDHKKILECCIEAKKQLDEQKSD